MSDLTPADLTPNGQHVVFREQGRAGAALQSPHDPESKVISRITSVPLTRMFFPVSTPPGKIPTVLEKHSLCVLSSGRFSLIHHPSPMLPVLVQQTFMTFSFYYNVHVLLHFMRCVQASVRLELPQSSVMSSLSQCSAGSWN